MDLRSVTYTSSAQAKIALFRSLFRGRVDVYPRRFESRTSGRAGYAPACANEWVRGICEKPRVRCADCAHRRFLPVTDDVIRWHLSGQGPDGQPFVAGVYPLLLDETCCFLAVDFDKAQWREDATTILETCGRLQLPAALERSRSGRGGHVWIFFEEALPAALARRLGSHLLTEAMEGRPDIGFDSYDRLFPSQDTLPQGGFGNLVALPLQRGPREKGNSVFLDQDGEPWPDQWAFLARIARIPRTRVERIVQEAEQRGRVLGVKLPPQEDGEHEPWTAPPSGRRRVTALAGALPESLELVLGNQIYIPKTPLPPALRNRLLRLCAFQNPEFYKAQALTEAFLYRRLQSLPETRGRFRLNASLPIAFDGTGGLEADLLCDDVRVAVELDGAQHLSDPAAYRRDRRKDQLLQENGYLVLRFLAETSERSWTWCSTASSER
jgi:hypothetical protein